jgi:hypothetical protein
MSRLILSTIIGGMIVAPFLCAPRASAQGVNVPDRFSYAAKFVCGTSPTPTANPPSEPVVKKGNYATAINIHNPWANTVIITKQVVIAAAERYPDTRQIPPTKRITDKLPAEQAMYVDCQEIVHLLVLSGAAVPAPFMEGFVIIDSYSSSPLTGDMPTELDVVTVTTTASATSAAGAAPGSDVNSHEITAVQGRKLPKGSWPF